MSQSLPEELLRERNRIRDVVIPAYESIGPSGAPALTLFIRPALERADAAITGADAVAMVRALNELREISL